MSLFKFGDYEKDLDFTDPDLIDQIEVADNKAKNAAQNIPPVGKTSDKIRALNKCYDTFFVDVLGADAVPLLFGTNNSYKLRMDAYNAFCEAINQTTAEINESTAKRFTPNKTPQNRQQRRQFDKRRR